MELEQELELHKLTLWTRTITRTARTDDLALGTITTQTNNLELELKLELHQLMTWN